MRRIRIPLAFALAAVLALGSIAAPALAVTPAALGSDSIVGVYAAVGCGMGIRLSILTGGYPPVVVATIAVCLVMVVDALVSPDH